MPSSSGLKTERRYVSCGSSALQGAHQVAMVVYRTRLAFGEAGFRSVTCILVAAASATMPAADDVPAKPAAAINASPRAGKLVAFLNPSRSSFQVSHPGSAQLRKIALLR